jgi:hypothetical protein
MKELSAECVSGIALDSKRLKAIMPEEVWDAISKKIFNLP